MLYLPHRFVLLAWAASAVLGFTQPPSSIGTMFCRSTSRLLAFTPPVSPLDVSGSFISNLAEIAIKLRLADQTLVRCEVMSTSTDKLLGGKIGIGPVSVKGRGWRSGRGLTCRVIEATVQTCELDVGRIIVNQKLVLTRPAEGKCMIALDENDFVNFITHPLMRQPTVANGGELKFLKEKANVNVELSHIVFYVEFRGHKWECILERSMSTHGTAQVTARPVSPIYDSPNEDVTELSSVLTKFFNELTYELDGTFLSYRDMMVTDKGSAPSVMLALNILVRKFPSPGIDF